LTSRPAAFIKKEHSAFICASHRLPDLSPSNRPIDVQPERRGTAVFSSATASRRQSLVRKGIHVISGRTGSCCPLPQLQDRSHARHRRPRQAEDRKGHLSDVPQGTCLPPPARRCNPGITGEKAEDTGPKTAGSRIGQVAGAMGRASRRRSQALFHPVRLFLRGRVGTPRLRHRLRHPHRRTRQDGGPLPGRTEAAGLRSRVKSSVPPGGGSLRSRLAGAGTQPPSGRAQSPDGLTSRYKRLY